MQLSFFQKVKAQIIFAFMRLKWVLIQREYRSKAPIVLCWGNQVMGVLREQYRGESLHSNTKEIWKTSAFKMSAKEGYQVVVLIDTSFALAIKVVLKYPQKA